MTELQAPPSNDRRGLRDSLAFVPSDALEQTDRITAETLIRSTVQVLANGAAVRDLDGLVQRNVGNVSLADIRAGRLGSNVLGDIISTVEQAKGTAPFNWSAATPQQISAYLKANGFSLNLLRDAAGNLPRDRVGGNGESARNASSIDYGKITGNFGVDRDGALSGFTHQMFNTQFKPLGYNEPTARNVAAILGKSEGLHGEALAKRIKEVARDTKDKLDLDVNTYAPKIARMGKEYSDPIISDKGLLDEARRLAKEGKLDEAHKVMERYRASKRQNIERAQRNKPHVAPDVKDTYKGLEKKFIKQAPELKQDVSDAQNFGTVGATSNEPSPPQVTNKSVQSAQLQDQGFFTDPPQKTADVPSPAAQPNPAPAQAHAEPEKTGAKPQVVAENKPKPAANTGTPANKPVKIAAADKPKPKAAGPQIA